MRHSSFWLRTSSNTPSILMNVAQGSFRKSHKGNALSILQLLSSEASGRTGTIQDKVAIWMSSTTSQNQPVA
jgi:hypothetical protein